MRVNTETRQTILDTLLKCDRDAHEEDSAVLADQIVADLSSAGLLNKLPSEEEMIEALYQYESEGDMEMRRRMSNHDVARWAYDFIRNYGRG